LVERISMSTHRLFSTPADLIPERQSSRRVKTPWRLVSWAALSLTGLMVVGLLAWQAITAAGQPNPLAAHTASATAVLDIAILVFREGLECVLVLAAITASLGGSRPAHQRSILAGAAIAFAATLITWQAAIAVISDLAHHIGALAVQAGTGLLAVLVLVVVMNWFFHKMYWTGWISLHNRRKRSLLDSASETGTKRLRLLGGFALLGFTSLYREGFEVVLFLQGFRLKLGNKPIAYGVLLGLLFSGIVALLTFIAHRRLPYRRMLVLTGILLGVVLLVMVGEQAQEMQLAHWLPVTSIPWLTHMIPSWMGLWFSVFPTVETLLAQALAAFLVLGCYFAARLNFGRAIQRSE
jgi:high-affinity iron transporter